MSAANESMTGRDDDGALHWPLTGLRLIEASAGTGKTFALATLVLRRLLEYGDPLPNLLVVTFTRAATEELRERLRRRLRLAQRLHARDDDSDSDGESQATRAVLARAVALHGAERVRARIAAAVLQLDEAAISTIHGFCHRALREFGFRAGLLAPRAIVDDAGEIWSDVAADVWRKSAHGDADAHAWLVALWSEPDALAGDLPKLCDTARALLPAAGESESAQRLHALRDAARERYDAAMALRGLSDQDRAIEDVWRASAQPAFAAALGARWPALLIDEFQDTDARQWDIFRRIHEQTDAEKRWLCLIGDPKQAIYRFRGGDPDTYLDAKRYILRHAGDAPNGEPIDTRSDTANDDIANEDATKRGTAPGLSSLDANYRSTPGVLRAIDTVFRQHVLPFAKDGIAFHSLRAASGARDDDLRLDDAPVPPMTVHWLPENPDPKSKGLRVKEQEYAMMAAAAVDSIVDLLARGTLRDANAQRPVRPADIAVLTQTHDQAALMQRALTSAGVAAAALSTASVFAGEAADDLDALIAALSEPNDASRLRAALATRLLGFDAAALRALDDDGAEWDTQAARFEAAAELWRTRGPLPALLPFVAGAAQRWLAETGGARRLTDALHLIELLQAESAQRHGANEQRLWFARQRAPAARADETRQLRLESDAGAVQIATIHRSKGLEYGVVVLPFLAYLSERPDRGLTADDVRVDGHAARVWHHKTHLVPNDLSALLDAATREERAEAQRQFYVALTRARCALHVVWSRNRSTERTALHHLLHDGAPTGRVKDALDYAGMDARIRRLAADSEGSIVVRDYAPNASRPVLRARDAERSAATPPTRIPQRRFGPDLRLHSFSALHARGAEPFVRPGADDETAPALADDATTLGGTAFGNAVHEVLESADAAAWRLALPPDLFGEETCPPSQRTLMERALRHQGIAATPAHIAETSRLVARALNAPLPGGVRLCDLSHAQCVRELPFHFRLRDARLDALSRLLAALGYPWAPRTLAGALDGFMHGYIDLVYRDPRGRHHVLDYKTNRLPAYDAASLRRAVVQHDYDLQYLIYLVALRRWLRLRRGAAYDERRDLGGAVYLFLRGIDLNAPASHEGGAQGVHLDAVSATTIATLDAFFDGADADVLIAALPTERKQ
ncbi:MAG: UvrD-helicase domain-containing protein [Xanthomonadaceae bacterium]|nr:UvrD-helicase domain-containing protein [Xanthomonadaceae bacterium]